MRISKQREFGATFLERFSGSVALGPHGEGGAAGAPWPPPPCWAASIPRVARKPLVAATPMAMPTMVPTTVLNVLSATRLVIVISLRYAWRVVSALTEPRGTISQSWLLYSTKTETAGGASW